MKRLTLILTILIAAASCALSAADAPKRHGWGEDGPLYGNVESVTVTKYSLKDSFGVISRSKINSKSCYKFKESGDVTEEASYKSDGSLSHKFIYKYDKKGNLTEWATYNSDGSLRTKCIYEKYDSKGNRTEETQYDGSSLDRITRHVVYTIIYRK